MIHKIKWSAVLSALSAIFLAGNVAHADDAWLKASGLGPYADTKQDWSAIEKAARAEGKVVIYSVSSRFSKLVKGFKEKYGVDIEGYDIPSDLQLEKFRRTQGRSACCRRFIQCRSAFASERSSSR